MMKGKLLGMMDVIKWNFQELVLGLILVNIFIKDLGTEVASGNKFDDYTNLGGITNI